MSSDKNEEPLPSPTYNESKRIKSPQCCPLCSEEDNIWRELPCGHKMCTHCMVKKTNKDPSNTSFKICPMSECETKFTKVSPKGRLERRYWKANPSSSGFITNMDYSFDLNGPPSESEQRLSLDLKTEKRFRKKRKQYEEDDEIRIERKGKIYEAKGELLTQSEFSKVLRDNDNRDVLKELKSKLDDTKKENFKLEATKSTMIFFIIFCILAIGLLVICWLFGCRTAPQCDNLDLSKLSFEIIPKYH